MANSRKILEYGSLGLAGLSGIGLLCGYATNNPELIDITTISTPTVAIAYIITKMTGEPGYNSLESKAEK